MFFNPSTGTASGDSQSGAVHKFVTLVRDLEGDGERAGSPEGEGAPLEVHSMMCDLDDVWSQQFPLPLSSQPSKPIRTGSGNFTQCFPFLDLSLLNFNYVSSYL